jgi:transposase-like protein
MLTCPTCRNPMRVRTIEVVDAFERVRFSCDSCRAETVRELSKSKSAPLQLQD